MKRKVLAVIEARMTSHRMPGKVLAILAGKPLLWHIVYRLRKTKLVNSIVLATTTNSTDDVLEKFAAQEGISVIRGPEENILERHLMAVQKFSPDIILRITGDAPLIDPLLIDRSLQTMMEIEADFVTVKPGVPCIHEGIDPFSATALRKLSVEAGNDPYAREHVSSFFKLHPNFCKIIYIEIPPEEQIRNARISVDTPADLEFLETLYARLQTPPGEADVRDVVKLLLKESKLLDINSHVRRKTEKHTNREILFRCDGGKRQGLGHIYRCLGLADVFRETYGCGVTFALAEDECGKDVVRTHAVALESKPIRESEDEWMLGLSESRHFDALVLDVRSDLSKDCIKAMCQKGLLTCVIDDPSDRRLAADLAFYPPVPQLERLRWPDFTGTLYSGWQWVILRREFSQIPKRQFCSGDTPVVLITMGGSDPQNLTLSALTALNGVDVDFKLIVVLGPAYPRDDVIDNLLASSGRKYEILRNVTRMSHIMPQADVAISSFGVTAYELAALGVPGIYLCLTEDHAESAQLFERAGIGRSLGAYTRVNFKKMVGTLVSLLFDSGKRKEMAERGPRLVDGRGAERVADIIMEKLAHA